MHYYTAAQKKKGLSHQKYFSNLAHTRRQIIGDQQMAAFDNSQPDLNEEQMMVNENFHQQQSLLVRR